MVLHNTLHLCASLSARVSKYILNAITRKADEIVTSNIQGQSMQIGGYLTAKVESEESFV